MDDETTLRGERMNIVCKAADDETAIELPLRLLFMGDYVGRDERPIDQRTPVRLDKDNFAKVMAAHRPRLDLVVSTAPVAEKGSALSVSLAFRAIHDFAPDSVAEQIPEVRQLLAVRDALTALKHTGDVATFRARVEQLLEDAPEREHLLSRVGLGAR
jgi:type VI secretion system protein ImpB